MLATDERPWGGHTSTSGIAGESSGGGMRRGSVASGIISAED
jgi:hypothetical protein